MPASTPAFDATSGGSASDSARRSSTWLRPFRPIFKGLRGLVCLTWPARCPACDVEVFDPGLCPTCAALAVLRMRPRCMRCDHDLPVAAPNHRCGRCLARPPAFARAFGLFDYSGPVGAAIRLAKYGKQPEVLEHLRRAWIFKLPEALIGDPPGLVVPVPLHWWRLHQRGFSPPLVVAAQVARALGRPVAGRALRRVRATTPQAGLPEAGRRANLRGAIEARRSVSADVLLVDDVFTTGATANACATALRRAGAPRVRVLCLAQVGRTPAEPDPKTHGSENA